MAIITAKQISNHLFVVFFFHFDMFASKFHCLHVIRQNSKKCSFCFISIVGVAAIVLSVSIENCTVTTPGRTINLRLLSSRSVWVAWHMSRYTFSKRRPVTRAAVVVCILSPHPLYLSLCFSRGVFCCLSMFVLLVTKRNYETWTFNYTAPIDMSFCVRDKMNVYYHLHHVLCTD